MKLSARSREGDRLLPELAERLGGPANTPREGDPAEGVPWLLPKAAPG